MATPQIVPAPPARSGRGRCGSWPMRIVSCGTRSSSAARVLPVARAVLDAGDDAGERGGEARDQVDRQRHARKPAACGRGGCAGADRRPPRSAARTRRTGPRRTASFKKNGGSTRHAAQPARTRMPRQRDRLGQRRATGRGDDARGGKPAASSASSPPRARRPRTTGLRRWCRTARRRRRPARRASARARRSARGRRRRSFASGVSVAHQRPRTGWMVSIGFPSSNCSGKRVAGRQPSRTPIGAPAKSIAVH